MTATDDWPDGPNPSPERQAFHAPAVDIRDIGGTVTNTDPLALYEDDPRTVSLYQLASALAVAHANVAALQDEVFKLRAEVERLQADNTALRNQLDRTGVWAASPTPTEGP